LTEAAGLTPALSARQPGGAFELNSSSERTLLKVFSTQTKRIVFVALFRSFPDIMTPWPESHYSRLFATLNWSPTMALMFSSPSGLPWSVTKTVLILCFAIN